MIKTGTSKQVFVEGRGNVSGKIAKSNEDVLHEESEVLEMESEAISGDKGAESRISGSKPVFATGERPFHEGRGLGRGHGPETAKNA